MRVGLAVRSASLAATGLCLAALAVSAQDASVPVTAPLPILKTDTAVYSLDAGVLQYAFAFVNPSDSEIFLDCQVPPRATLSGSVLRLDFDRKADPKDAAGAPVDAKDFPPQRIGPHQTFQGQRRLDRLLGEAQVRPKFSRLQLRMAYYPEASGGEEAFDAGRQGHAESGSHAVARRGKVPPPPKIIKHDVRAPG